MSGNWKTICVLQKPKRHFLKYDEVCNKTVAITIQSIHSSERLRRPFVHYWFKGMPFRRVWLFGIIIKSGYKNNGNFYMWIDDGTAMIEVILSKQDMKEAQHKYNLEITSEGTSEDSDAFWLTTESPERKKKRKSKSSSYVEGHQLFSKYNGFYSYSSNSESDSDFNKCSSVKQRKRLKKAQRSTCCSKSLQNNKFKFDEDTLNSLNDGLQLIDTFLDLSDSFQNSKDMLEENLDNTYTKYKMSVENYLLTVPNRLKASDAYRMRLSYDELNVVTKTISEAAKLRLQRLTALYLKNLKQDLITIKKSVVPEINQLTNTNTAMPGSVHNSFEGNGFWKSDSTSGIYTISGCQKSNMNSIRCNNNIKTHDSNIILLSDEEDESDTSKEDHMNCLNDFVDMLIASEKSTEFYHMDKQYDEDGSSVVDIENEEGIDVSEEQCMDSFKDNVNMLISSKKNIEPFNMDNKCNEDGSSVIDTENPEEKIDVSEEECMDSPKDNQCDKDGSSVVDNIQLIKKNENTENVSDTSKIVGGMHTNLKGDFPAVESTSVKVSQTKKLKLEKEWQLDCTRYNRGLYITVVGNVSVHFDQKVVYGQRVNILNNLNIFPVYQKILQKYKKKFIEK